MPTTRPAEFVLDASAVLALAQAETGADVVAQVLPHAILSAVNLTEVVAVLRRGGMSSASVDAVLSRFQVPVHSFDQRHARVTAELIAATRQAGLSLGDCACLALGRLRDAPVVTAEKGWKKLGLGIEIRAIR